MAQIIKHRRGGLESVSGATKRAGELLVITGSSGLSAGNGDGLLFVGIDGSTVTPANKILTGSSTPDLTGGSYDTSIDGLPFYNTSENKFYILAKGGNTEVKTTANTDGTGIVSSSAQIDTLGFLQVNGDSVVSSSAQISNYGTFLEINGDSVVSSSAQISGYNTFLEINGMGVVSGSSQISLDSVTGTIDDVSGFTTFSGSVDTRVDALEEAVGAGSNIDGRLTALEVFSGSTETSLAEIHAHTASVDSSLTAIHSYTSSLKTGISLDGANVTILGNLQVQGTTTTVDSTTISLGDNIIQLNGTGAAYGGLIIVDSTAPNQVSGSLLWDATNDYWIAGASGSESKVLLAGGDGVVSGSAQVTSLLPAGTVSGSSQVDADSITNFDSNVKDKLNVEGVISGSSQVQIGSVTGFSSFSSSLKATDDAQDVRLDNLEAFSSSLGDGFATDAELAAATGALESADSAQQARLSSIESFTSSIDTTIKTKLNTETVVSGSSQVDGTSITNNTISGVALGSNLYDLTVDNTTIVFNSGTTYNGGAAKTISVGEITDSNVATGAAISYTKVDFEGSGITSGSLNLSIAGDTGTDTVTVGSDTFTFEGTADEIVTTVSDNKVTIALASNPTLSGNVTITGNLSIEGTTTTIDSTTVNIGDRILELNYGGASGNAGLLVTDAVGGTTVSGSLLWDATNDKWIGGALGSEKELARLNSAPSSNTVLKSDANGLLVDSLITDDGTNVTISGTAELRLNAGTANSFVYLDSNKSVEAVTPSNAGDIIQWNGSSFVASNELDGGTF